MEKKFLHLLFELFEDLFTCETNSYTQDLCIFCLGLRSNIFLAYRLADPRFWEEDNDLNEPDY